MPSLREAVRKTYERLFPEEPSGTQEQEAVINVPVASDSDEDEQDQQPQAKKCNYAEHVSKLFDEALNTPAIVSTVSIDGFLAVLRIWIRQL